MLCFYISICGGISYGIFFFKQKTAYEMRISDWSSDVCSSDLVHLRDDRKGTAWTSKVESFRLARHLTTRALLHGDSSDDSSKPAVNLSWRSEERRVGKGCVRPCRSGWSPYNEKKNTTH